jgi:hypothetical protein
VAPEQLGWAVGALAEGVGIRAVARVFAVDPKTVLVWLVEVAEQAAACSPYVLHDVRVTQVPRAALLALLSAVQTGEVSDTEAIQRLERSPHGVWGALAPVTTRRRTLDVGDRTLALAPRVVQQVVQGLAPGGVPWCLTDGCKDSLTALLTHYGQWGQCPRRPDTGPAPTSRWRPLPQLLEAPGIKTVRRRRLGRVCHRGVCGTLEAVPQVLAAHGWQINTACLERVNLSMRQPVAAVGRRGSTRWKGEEGWRQQLAW